MSTDASYIDKIPYVDSGFIITLDFLEYHGTGYLGYFVHREDRLVDPFEVVRFCNEPYSEPGPMNPKSAFGLFQELWPDGVEAQTCLRYLIANGKDRLAFNIVRTLILGGVKLDCTTEVEFPLEKIGFIAVAGNLKAPSIRAQGVAATGYVSSAVMIDTDEGVYTGGDIGCGFGGLQCRKGSIGCEGNISSSGPIDSAGFISAKGIRSESSISANKSIVSKGKISTPSYIFSKEDLIESKTSIYAGGSLLAGTRVVSPSIFIEGRIHCGFSPTHTGKDSPGSTDGYVDYGTPVYGIANSNESYVPKSK